MQINRGQANDNTTFMAFRFTKAAKVHIKDTFTNEDIIGLRKLVEEHKKISLDVLVGTDVSLFGSTRLRARVGKLEDFDTSIFFEEGFPFLQSAANYAKRLYEKLGMSISDALKDIYKK